MQNIEIDVLGELSELGQERSQRLRMDAFIHILMDYAAVQKVSRPQSSRAY